MWRIVVLVAVVSLAACADTPECRAPDHTTYTCEPIPAGGDGCVGGPIWRPKNSGNAAAQQNDPALTFPLGCTASIPDCSGTYPGAARQFTCENDGWSELL